MVLSVLHACRQNRTRVNLNSRKHGVRSTGDEIIQATLSPDDRYDCNVGPRPQTKVEVSLRAPIFHPFLSRFNFGLGGWGGVQVLSSHLLLQVLLN